MTVPTKPGFYWAKWRSAAPGTADNGECCPGDIADWEVVEVWENSLDPTDDEYLLVHVGGVAKAQGLHRFEWGTGPLVPPSPTQYDDRDFDDFTQTRQRRRHDKR